MPAGSLLLSPTHTAWHSSSHTFHALLTLIRRFLLEPPFGFLAHHFRRFIRILYSFGTHYFLMISKFTGKLQEWYEENMNSDPRFLNALL